MLKQFWLFSHQRFRLALVDARGLQKSHDLEGLGHRWRHIAKADATFEILDLLDHLDQTGNPHAINNLALLEINDEVLDPLFNALVASGSDFLSTLIVDIAFHCQDTNAISLLQIQPKIRHSDTFNLAVIK